METEYGRQMGRAIRAVLDMQDDCIRLFHDLDKALRGYESVLGNTVTLNLGSSINRRTYLADGLLRIYAHKGNQEHVLGVNICFYDKNDSKFTEPIFVVANITYQDALSDPAERALRPWDPWYAFLEWIPERVYEMPIKLDKPPKRSCIDNIIVAAAPLGSITNIQAATRIIDMVGRP